MRKIIDRTCVHNAAVVRTATLVLLCAALAAAGCSRRQDAAPAPQATAAAPDCPVVVDVSGWQAFRAIADRLAAGQEVPRAELEAWGELPAVETWRRSQAPLAPRVANLANWIEGAWWEELGREGNQKVNADRVILGRGYRYSQARADRIDRMLADFTGGDGACAVRRLAEAWLDTARIPTPLRLDFLPAMAEIRLFDGTVIVDTGVLAAGGIDQTSRQIVTLLYRNHEALPGANPIESQGAAAVAECFRVFMNEGVAAHIEQTQRVEFDPDHPSLHKVHIVPEEFFRKAQQAVATITTWLTPMFADEQALADRGNAFARSLTGGNSFTPLGIAMAEVIVARQGEDGLRRVHRSVPDFVAAYQQAALANPVPAPEPGAVGITLDESVPPLDPAVYERLHELLVRYFPAP